MIPIFRKSISTTASFLILYAFSLCVWADELVDLYGQANVSLQSADEGDGSFTEMKSNASRIGVRGEEDLDNGLTVFYQLEWQVDLADIADSDNITSRDQFVGLQGDFGKIMLGRINTVTKQLSMHIDLFNHYEGDIRGLWKGEARVNDSLTYFSPSLSGFTVAMTYVAEEDAQGDDATSVGVYYGDPKLKGSKFYAAVTSDDNIADYDTQRLVLSGKLAQWKLGAVFHRQEPATGGESKSGTTLSAQYSLGDWKLNSQYQSLEDDDSVSVGADYKVGDKTKLYAWYTKRELDSDEDKRWLAVGLEHKF
ncbi:MAG: porin [Aestuariibacter sp.]